MAIRNRRSSCHAWKLNVLLIRIRKKWRKQVLPGSSRVKTKLRIVGFFCWFHAWLFICNMIWGEIFFTKDGKLLAKKVKFHMVAFFPPLLIPFDDKLERRILRIGHGRKHVWFMTGWFFFHYKIISYTHTFLCCGFINGFSPPFLNRAILVSKQNHQCQEN